MARKPGYALIKHRISCTVFVSVLLAAAWSIRSAPVLGQGKEVRNPMAGDAKASQLGKAYFRTRCGPCHGVDARGGAQGPDLISGRRVHGESDADVYRTITQGLAGTAMPANELPDAQTWAIMAFLRAQSATSHPPVPGDRARGKDLFFGKANCAGCHMVDGRGGRLGPDLSRVGASRSIQFLTESIREPSKDLSEGLKQLGAQAPCPVIYDTVTVMTGDGRRITGLARNEDNYSLQLMDVDGELHMLLKKDLQEVVHERKSLMPAYDDSVLGKNEMQDLLAYLQSLQAGGARGGEAARAPAAKGIDQ